MYFDPSSFNEVTERVLTSFKLLNYSPNDIEVLLYTLYNT